MGLGGVCYSDVWCLLICIRGGVSFFGSWVVGYGLFWKWEGVCAKQSFQLVQSKAFSSCQDIPLFPLTYLHDVMYQ